MDVKGALEKADRIIAGRRGKRREKFSWRDINSIKTDTKRRGREGGIAGRLDRLESPVQPAHGEKDSERETRVG